nr:D-glycero-beta-D-manno-heptose 1,7-bisphosphate 7-phosphatase [Rosenbergiella epipactidis]
MLFLKSYFRKLTLSYVKATLLISEFQVTIIEPVKPLKASAAFLDRDGVINKEVNYCHKISEFELVEGIVDVLLSLQKKFTHLIVVTNQAGIGRGYYSEQQFQTLTQWMTAHLRSLGITVTHVYFCPHHLSGIPPFNIECECRKPKPGMIMSALEKYNIDPAASVLIGDKVSDLQAAMAANLSQAWLVGTGHPVGQADIEVSDHYFPTMSDLEHFLNEGYVSEIQGR